MKEMNMLIWLTQLGLSVALPLAGFILLAYWLMQRFGLGAWVMIAGCVIGMICAVDGLRNSLKLMERLDRKNAKKSTPPVSFNDHD